MGVYIHKWLVRLGRYASMLQDVRASRKVPEPRGLCQALAYFYWSTFPLVT
jgi:hypothetical protein